jgi:uncharacterized RmlC-like cupin family protein
MGLPGPAAACSLCGVGSRHQNDFPHGSSLSPTLLPPVPVTSPTCKVVPSGSSYVGQQGFTYLTGLTGVSAGSQALCMTVLTLPDGARAKTHLHRGIETGAFLIEGQVEMYFGDRLEHHLHARAGEYVYVPSDTPHLVMNRSGAPCLVLVAHSAADDQAGIELLPHLDALV